MQNSSFNNFLSDGKNGFSEAEGIVVLSLFDGMSCGQLALQKLGIKVKQYYAAETSEAIRVSREERNIKREKENQLQEEYGEQ